MWIMRVRAALASLSLSLFPYIHMRAEGESKAEYRLALCLPGSLTFQTSIPPSHLPKYIWPLPDYINALLSGHWENIALFVHYEERVRLESARWISIMARLDWSNKGSRRLRN